MGKFFHTKKEIKSLGDSLKPGDVFYTVSDVSRDVAPYEAEQLYNRYVVTHDHPLLGGAMVGSRSVESLAQEGGAYLEPPKGMRGTHQPAPQVAGPDTNANRNRVADDGQYGATEHRKQRNRWF
jgi:hypothetical protein